MKRVAAVGVASAAVLGIALAGLSTARADAPPPRKVDFSILNARHPVAGHRFEGLTIINRTGLNGYPERFSAVRCDAQVGRTRLRARKLVYGKPRDGYVQVIVCDWLVPAGAAGKTLRLWRNVPDQRLHGVSVVLGGNSVAAAGDPKWPIRNQ